MPELTLESLAKRVEELERLFAQRLPTPANDWRSVVGNSEDNEFTRQMLAAIEENSEAERQAALAEDGP